MPEQPDYAALQARVSKLEIRVEQVATDATAARHLAAANDRDYADILIKVDANRAAINALGVQTAERFDALERKFDNGFAEMRAKHDQTAGALARIIDLITGRIGPEENL